MIMIIPQKKIKLSLPLKRTLYIPETLGLEDEFPFGARPPDRCELLVFGSLNVRLFSCLEKHMKNKTCSLN